MSHILDFGDARTSSDGDATFPAGDAAFAVGDVHISRRWYSSNGRWAYLLDVGVTLPREMRHLHREIWVHLQNLGYVTSLSIWYTFERISIMFLSFKFNGKKSVLWRTNLRKLHNWCDWMFNLFFNSCAMETVAPKSFSKIDIWHFYRMKYLPELVLAYFSRK